MTSWDESEPVMQWLTLQTSWHVAMSWLWLIRSIQLPSSQQWLYQSAPILPDKYCVSVDDVDMKLMAIQLRKGTGPDGIPNWVLRDVAGFLAAPIASIFNSPFWKGFIPRIWQCLHMALGHYTRQDGQRSVCGFERNLNNSCRNNYVSGLAEVYRW